MKKLMFALALTGFWFNASKCVTSEDEVREKAKRAIDQNVARFKSEQMAGYFESEFKISIKQEAAKLSQFMRDFQKLMPQSSKIDDKNGAKVLELSQKLSGARENVQSAMEELQMYLGPVKGSAVNIIKETIN